MSRLTDCQAKLKAANAQIVSLTAALDTANVSLATCASTSVEKDKQIADLSAQLEAADTTIGDLNLEVADLQQKLDDCLNPPPPPPPTATCVFGSTTSVQTDLGLAHHSYASWDSDPLNPADLHAYISPDTAFYNLKFAPTDWIKGTNALWEEIAAGNEDTRIQQWADMLNQVPQRMAIALHHEPMPDAGGVLHEGDPSTLASATRRVMSMWRAAGVKHFLGQCLLKNQFTQFPTLLVTPDADFVGVDAYGQGSANTAEAVFASTLTYAQQNAKPLVIFETNYRDAVEGDGQQTIFYESLDAWLKTTPDVIGCCLWLGVWEKHDNHLNAEGLAVVTRMASDPYYSKVF
jgi:hypothetical protein